MYFMFKELKIIILSFKYNVIGLSTTTATTTTTTNTTTTSTFIFRILIVL